MAANKNDMLEHDHKVNLDFAVTRESVVELRNSYMVTLCILPNVTLVSIGQLSKQCIDMVRARDRTWS